MSSYAVGPNQARTEAFTPLAASQSHEHSDGARAKTGEVAAGVLGVAVVAAVEVSLRFKDGSRYQGDIKDGKPHGYGVMTYAAADSKQRIKYEGQFNEGIIHGRGKMIYTENEVYEGEWQNGVGAGKGKYSFKNGSIYTGQFKNGEPNGHGCLEYADGDTREGNFVNSVMDGPIKFGSRSWAGHTIKVFKDGKVVESGCCTIL